MTCAPPRDAVKWDPDRFFRRCGYQHKCKVTVLDKKLYPELQAQYCADPNAGPCPCRLVGDAYIFERYGQADDFWHMGAGTLANGEGRRDGTAGSPGVPPLLRGLGCRQPLHLHSPPGRQRHAGRMNDRRVMIVCCSDGTRPVIFEIERLDYKALYIQDIGYGECRERAAALSTVSEAADVAFRETFAEVYLDRDVPCEDLKQVAAACGAYTVTKID